MQNHFVDASNGVCYAYRCFGDGAQTPLLLLSHFRANLDMWDPLLISEIAAERPVVLVDNAGIGLSGGRTPHTIEEMARDIHAFIQALQLNEVDLLGFSIGGYVAQELAFNHPNLVRRVILAGTAPRGTGGDLALSGRAHTSATKEVIGSKDLLFLFFPANPAGRERGVDFIRRLGQHRPDPDRSVSRSAWQAQIAAATAWGLPNPGALTKLAHMTQPTLVAHGELDVMVDPEKGRLLAEHMPNSIMRVFQDAGHAFLFQNPEEFAATVRDFLGAASSDDASATP
ncbi:alpha/beta fold hydrolase [Streptomyces coffeae]|uniref:Alpha/beta hydrolase n=1 Tax=Streptomyces coffeae TaxID=621382 RepID=A0ABS1NRR4_9ACTN|nr:alpha/beta hydrolase [Streptomyces coffeae]MBL1102796.1 alpha/beta hydrolase [Streptomyces coffeae]